jgi:Glycosyltransferase family 87
VAALKAIAVCALGVALIATAVWQAPERDDDFRWFYRAATFASAHRSVYSNPPFFPGTDNNGLALVPYNRIPSYAHILRPLAALSFPSARRVWIGLACASFLAWIWLFPADGRRGFAIAASYSFPVAFTLVLGQDIGFVVLFAMLAARAFTAGREFLAGLAASVIGIKITYLPAAGLVFMAKSRRGTLGFLTGIVIQLAVSFALEGGGWPAEYVSVFTAPAIVLDPEPRRMPSIRAIAAGLSLPAGVWLIGAIALYLAFWWVCRRLSAADALIVALPIGLIASPHCYVYDAVVLIPLFVRCVSFDAWEGFLAYIGLSPVPYLLLLSQHASYLLTGSLMVVTATLAATICLYRHSEPRCVPPSKIGQQLRWVTGTVWRVPGSRTALSGEIEPQGN